MVESLSYNCTDATKLLCLDRMLKEVETKLRAMLPHQDGILLRPALITHSAKKVSQKYKKLNQRSLKYSALSLHSKGRHKKKDWRFGNQGTQEQKGTIANSGVVVCTMSCIMVLISDFRRSITGTEAAHTDGKNATSTFKVTIQ